MTTEGLGGVVTKVTGGVVVASHVVVAKILNIQIRLVSRLVSAQTNA